MILISWLSHSNKLFAQYLRSSSIWLFSSPTVSSIAHCLAMCPITLFIALALKNILSCFHECEHTVPHTWSPALPTLLGKLPHRIQAHSSVSSAWNTSLILPTPHTPLFHLCTWSICDTFLVTINCNDLFIYLSLSRLWIYRKYAFGSLCVGTLWSLTNVARLNEWTQKSML